MNAEAGHIPQAAIDAWQQAGPLRVRRELAARLRGLADRGVLRVEDPDRAALHFSVLISPPNPSFRAAPAAEEEIDENVVSGVRAFLHGYLSG